MHGQPHIRLTFIHSLVRLSLHSHISRIDRYGDGEDNLATFPAVNPPICGDLTQLIVVITDVRRLTTGIRSEKYVFR